MPAFSLDCAFHTKMPLGKILPMRIAVIDLPTPRCEQTTTIHVAGVYRSNDCKYSSSWMRRSRPMIMQSFMKISPSHCCRCPHTVRSAKVICMPFPWNAMLALPP